MDPNYRASEQQWNRVEWMHIRHRFAGSECLLELRARIEALEAAQQPAPSAPAGGLVERVHSCIVGEPECGHMQARAAIREVVAWLRSEPWLGRAAADRLEQEAER
jgi:hypothetical protein